MAKIIIMNVGIDKTFLNLNLARKLLIMVKNAGSKNKRGRLMKNMKSPNSGLKVNYTHAGVEPLKVRCMRVGS